MSFATAACDAGTDGMSAAEELMALQRQQLQHDQVYHLDVWSLPIPERMAHYCIHFAKYVGQFVSNDVSVRRTAVIDVAVIALAAANTMNLDLRHTETFQAARAAPSLDAYCKGWFQRPLHEAFLPFLGEYARATDKACHLERYDIRSAYETSVEGIVALAFCNLASNDPGITKSLGLRLFEVEERNVLLAKDRI